MGTYSLPVPPIRTHLYLLLINTNTTGKNVLEKRSISTGADDINSSTLLINFTTKIVFFKKFFTFVELTKHVC